MRELLGKTASRVVIADDRAHARMGLRALLTTWPDVEVVGEAANGNDAVQLIAERHPDVVLMDAWMPRVDGMAATRIVKDLWPGVRVIVLTVDSSCRAEAMAAGADGFLVKGCPAEDLLRAIVEPRQ